jgi:hypothetical protein
MHDFARRDFLTGALPPMDGPLLEPPAPFTEMLQMRSVLLTALLVAGGVQLSAQSFRIDFATPAWTSPLEFTMVTSIRELSDGRLIVTDPGERAIRLLAADGRSLRDIGRTGAGPKEFASPISAFALPGDSTLINDRDQQRFLLIGPDGEPVGTIPWPSIEASGLHGRVGSDGAGNLYFVKAVFARTGRHTALLRWHLRAPAADSIAAVRTQAVVRYKRTIDGREHFISRAVPFTSDDGWAVGPAGELVVIDPDQYTTTWRDADGALRKGPRIPFTPVPLTAAERSSALEGIDPAAKEGMDLPTARPAIRGYDVQMAPNVEAWVPRTAPSNAPKRTWDIIDRNGRLVRSIELSADRLVVGFGRRTAYVVHTDEDGLQHLEAYR